MIDPTDLDQLEPAEAYELGRLLQERAARQLRKVTVEEIRSLVREVHVSTTWEESILVEVGRIRTAAKQLTLDGYRPEQFAVALAQVGLEDAFPDGGVIANAIAAGIKDGRRFRS